MTQKRLSVETPDAHLERLANFPLLNAILGRRSRRFPLGGHIPDGPFAFRSNSPPQPLDDIETSIITSCMIGNTGWNNLIPYNAKYAPHLPNYAGSASGRSFPSAAGFHTTDLFFTDDSGIYYLSTRNSQALKENGNPEDFKLSDWLKDHQKLVKKISNHRLVIPREEPYVDGHNLWIVNSPGSLFAIPIADVAQHMILGLCYLVQNGYIITDDIHGNQIPGVEKFRHLVNVDLPYPLTYFEQTMLGECTSEVATSCFTGVLLLQAMGLGGWMYDGIDRQTIFGVPGDAKAPGLGFKSETDARWSTPNPIGLPGVFEAFCPPFFPTMSEAVDAVIERKFGPGGPFHAQTEGPWKETTKIRTAAVPHSDEFRELVKLQAQYIFDRFGKFPATIPSAYCLMYLQAQHIDLEYYDRFYEEGGYLETHHYHNRDWHSDSKH